MKKHTKNSNNFTLSSKNNWISLVFWAQKYIKPIELLIPHDFIPVYNQSKTFHKNILEIRFLKYSERKNQLNTAFFFAPKTCLPKKGRRKNVVWILRVTYDGVIKHRPLLSESDQTHYYGRNYQICPKKLSSSRSANIWFKYKYIILPFTFT